MDKVVIVTGAGRGIGAETAKLLARQGYAVCVNYLKNHQRADEVVEAITQSGGRAFAHQADVSDEGQVGNHVQCCQSSFWYGNSSGEQRGCIVPANDVEQG